MSFVMQSIECHYIVYRFARRESAADQRIDYINMPYAGQIRGAL